MTEPTEPTTEDIVSAIKDAEPDDLVVYVEALVERGGAENLRMLLGEVSGNGGGGYGLGRVPPQDVHAERAVLGAMLQYGMSVSQIVSETLVRGDFYHQAHGAIFEAMVALAHMGRPVDCVTTADELSRRSALDSSGGAAYLAELTACCPAPAVGEENAVRDHAAIVSEKAMRRVLIEAMTQFSALAYDESADVADIAAKAENAIFSARDRDSRSRKTWRDMPALIGPRLTSLFKEREAGPACSASVVTGYAELDRSVTVKPGNVIIIAGRPSMGKTSSAIGIGANAARRGKRVAVFSQEMTAEDLTDELLSYDSGVNGYKFEHPWHMTDADIERVTDAAGRLWTDCIEIDDTEELTPAEIAARCRRFRAKHGGLDLVIIDYLQLLRLSAGRPSENRNVEVGEIAKRLKGVAKRLHVPIILLSQLSRAVEKRDNKRPMLSDLYESGGVEAVGDVVIFIYRPAYYEQKREMENIPQEIPPHHRGDYWDRSDADEDESDHGTAVPQRQEDEEMRHPEEVEFIIAKQRKGPTGVVKLGFYPHLRKFICLEQHRTENPF